MLVYLKGMPLIWGDFGSCPLLTDGARVYRRVRPLSLVFDSKVFFSEYSEFLLLRGELIMQSLGAGNGPDFLNMLDAYAMDAEGRTLDIEDYSKYLTANEHHMVGPDIGERLTAIEVNISAHSDKGNKTVQKIQDFTERVLKWTKPNHAAKTYHDFWNELDVCETNADQGVLEVEGHLKFLEANEHYMVDRFIRDKLMAITGKISATRNQDIQTVQKIKAITAKVIRKIGPERPFEGLPLDLDAQILSLLNKKDFKSAALVSRKWAGIMYRKLLDSINQNPNIPLQVYGCDSVKKLMGFVKRHGEHLKILNFEGFRGFPPRLSSKEFKGIIKFCPNLRELAVSSQQIHDDALAHLEGMPLISVNFSGCWRLKDSALVYLSKLPFLTSVSFSRNPLLTDGALAHLKKIPLLTSVDFSRCSQLKDNALAHLRGMPLTSVNFSKCQLKDGALVHLKGMPLTSVNFSENPMLTDGALAHLKGMPLSSVNFSQCHQLTEGALVHLKGMPLTSVKLSECFALKDGALQHLKGMHLTSVDLSGCWELTDDALAHLEGMPLTELNVDGCRKMTEEALDRFRSRGIKVIRW